MRRAARWTSGRTMRLHQRVWDGWDGLELRYHGIKYKSKFYNQMKWNKDWWKSDGNCIQSLFVPTLVDLNSFRCPKNNWICCSRMHFQQSSFTRVKLLLQWDTNLSTRKCKPISRWRSPNVHGIPFFFTNVILYKWCECLSIPGNSQNKKMRVFPKKITTQLLKQCHVTKKHHPFLSML